MELEVNNMQERKETQAHEGLRTELEIPISDEYDVEDPALHAALSAAVDKAFRPLISIVRPDARIKFIKLHAIMDKRAESIEDIQRGLPIRRSAVIVVDYVLE